MIEGKEIQGIQIEKEEVKIFLLAGGKSYM